MRTLASALSIAARTGIVAVGGLIVAATWISSSVAGPLGNAILMKPGTPCFGGSCAYLYRRGFPEGVRIPLPRSMPASTAALSPGRPFVAYTVLHLGEPGIDPRSPASREVAVTDTTGQTVATFTGGVRIAWSPNGEKLAVGMGCEWEVIPAFDSVVVWEPGRGITLSRRVHTSRGLMGWTGADTVLVGSSVCGPAQALACRTGTVGPTHHRGTSVSPDGRYSIYPTMGGIGLGVFDDRTGSDFAYSLVTLLRFSKLGTVGPARWVRTKENGHTLALSACAASSGSKGAGQRPECLTELVDVATRRLVGWKRGTLVSVTANSREAVISRGDSLEFLREGDWNRTPLPVSRSSLAAAKILTAPVLSSDHRLVFAFTMQQIWSGDNGRFATALGYHSGTVYGLEANGNRRELLSRPFGLWTYEAALNQSGDLLAIAGQATDPGSPSVIVANTSGALIARFPGKGRFRWSPDGTRLVLVGDNLTVWDRRKGIVAKLPFRPDQEAWTSSGLLMIRIGERVTLLEWRSGDTTGTAHQAVDVSSDGAYSIDALHSWAGPRVFDDRMGVEITKCGWGEVHDLGWGLSGDPFWSREPHLRHDLWVNKCDERLLGIAEGRIDGCELALVDVEKMETVASTPGKLIGLTADGRSAVVLRGSELAIVPLDPDGGLDRIGSKRPPKASATKARIQAVVIRWSSGVKFGSTRANALADTVGTHLVAVRTGDWLTEFGGARCGRGMRVRRVISPDQVEIEYNAGALSVQSAGPSAGLATITRGAVTTFNTRSFDGGLTIRLTIAP